MNSLTFTIWTLVSTPFIFPSILWKTSWLIRRADEVNVCKKIPTSGSLSKNSFDIKPLPKNSKNGHFANFHPFRLSLQTLLFIIYARELHFSLEEQKRSISAKIWFGSAQFESITCHLININIPDLRMPKIEN